MTQNQAYICLFYSMYMQCNQEEITFYVKKSECLIKIVAYNLDRLHKWMKKPSAFL